MTDVFSDTFFDKVDGAKDGRSNGTLEMKELREALSSSFLSHKERKLAGMVLDEYDFAKSLLDRGGQVSRAELAQYVSLNRGRLDGKQNVFSSSSDQDNRRAYLANLMDRINFNFSNDNDDNKFLTRDELAAALNSGHDKNGEALSLAELELVSTLYRNWNRDIKNISEKKGEDNDGISVYDLYALAERRPRNFGEISDKVNQTFRSTLPELTLTQELPPKCRAEEGRREPQEPIPLPPEQDVPEEPRIPVPVPVPRVWIEEVRPQIHHHHHHYHQRDRFRLGEEFGRAAREIEILILRGGIRVPGQYHPHHHREHRNYDFHQGPRCEPKWSPAPRRDNYNFHPGRR